jgi:hypothetical protein
LFCFEKGSHFVAQDDIEFEILLPPLPKCWDYRNEMNILFSNQAKMANTWKKFSILILQRNANPNFLEHQCPLSQNDYHHENKTQQRVVKM